LEEVAFTSFFWQEAGDGTPPVGLSAGGKEVRDAMIPPILEFIY